MVISSPDDTFLYVIFDIIEERVIEVKELTDCGRGLHIYHYTVEMIFMASLHLNSQSTIRNWNCIDYKDLKENL